MGESYRQCTTTIPEVWNWFAGFSSRFRAEKDPDFRDIVGDSSL